MIEFLSGWPLNELKQQDRASLVEFLSPLLDEFYNPQDQFLLNSVITTIKKLRKSLSDSQAQVVTQRLSAFVTDYELSWPIRSRAAEVLAMIDIEGLLVTLRNVEVMDQFLLAEDFARTLASKTGALNENYPDTPPPTSQEFGQWQRWVKEVIHD